MNRKSLFKKFFKKKTKNNTVIKKKPFFPYENKVKRAYFNYLGLFSFLSLLVYIFSLFLIINLSKNAKFNLTSDIADINLVCTPILNIILITISLFLLLFAPSRVYHSTKSSNLMFYFSFFFLIIASLLNAQLQLTYIEKFISESFYNWIPSILAKIVIIISSFALIGVQVFLWIMRSKFSFMPTDYEVYAKKELLAKQAKAIKLEKKRLKQEAKTIVIN